jgi:hypothetical protein
MNIHHAAAATKLVILKIAKELSRGRRVIASKINLLQKLRIQLMASYGNVCYLGNFGHAMAGFGEININVIGSVLDVEKELYLLLIMRNILLDIHKTTDNWFDACFFNDFTLSCQQKRLSFINRAADSAPEFSLNGLFV